MSSSSTLVFRSRWSGLTPRVYCETLGVVRGVEGGFWGYVGYRRVVERTQKGTIVFGIDFIELLVDSGAA